MGDTSNGKTIITDKSKHIDLTDCNSQTANEWINSKAFTQFNVISDKLCGFQKF